MYKSCQISCQRSLFFFLQACHFWCVYPTCDPWTWPTAPLWTSGRSTAFTHFARRSSTWTFPAATAFQTAASPHFGRWRYGYTIFCKHVVYKHVRLDIAEKLSTLLSTPQAEISTGTKILFIEKYEKIHKTCMKLCQNYKIYVYKLS